MQEDITKKAIYISENSVSDLHGGGLTIQRILGEDLNKFEKFIHLSDFSEKYPITPRLKDRAWNVATKYLPLHRPSRKEVFAYSSYLFKRFLLREKVTSLYGIKKIVKEISESVDLETSKVLFVPQNYTSIYVSNLLFRQKPFSYWTWIMDDHTLQFDEQRGFFYADGFEYEMSYHLRNAKGVFVISYEMKEFYQERFGVISEVLFGSAESCDTPLYQPSEGEEIKIGYFGALWEWQSDAIKRMIPYLKENLIKLDIYSFHEIPKEMKCDRVAQKEPIKPEEVQRIMRTCDAVLIPIGFSSTHRSLSQFNYATKMSECLASGVPIVAVGPPYAAMIKFLRERKCAFIIDNPDDEEQWRYLKKVKDKTSRKEILDNAQSVFHLETSTAVMQARWKKFWR